MAGWMTAEAARGEAQGPSQSPRPASYTLGFVSP